MDEWVMVICLACGGFGFAMGLFSSQADIVRDCEEIGKSRIQGVVLTCEVKK